MEEKVINMNSANRGILSPNEYKSKKMRFLYTLFILVAVFLTLIMFYPFLWVFFGALKTSNEIYSLPPTFLPEDWLWGNFSEAWKFYEFARTMFNSLILYIGFYISKLFVIITAAYALSKIKLPARKFLYMLFLATLMLPTVAYLVPSYLVITKLPIINISLLDSYWAIWLPSGADSFALLMMKTFFDNIPMEISESGYIDGANHRTILKDLILPLAKPILAVLGIFAFLAIWNDFFWQRLVIISPSKWTISIMLWFRSTVTGATPSINVQLAAMFLSIIPPMIVFLIFQKEITEGAITSGIKG